MKEEEEEEEEEKRREEKERSGAGAGAGEGGGKAPEKVRRHCVRTETRHGAIDTPTIVVDGNGADPHLRSVYYVDGSETM